MCALVPPLLPNFGWLVVDQNSGSSGGERLRDSSVARPQHDLDVSGSFEIGTTDNPTTIKKKNHSASERHRRKKMNSLFSSLRSLLPDSDQSKKLSMPETVSRVIKYVPELQDEVKMLIRRKEELELRESKHDKHTHENDNKKQRKRVRISSESKVSAMRLCDTEVIIHLSAYRAPQERAVSDVVDELEKDGLQLMNAFSFESMGGRVFHTLHLEADKAYRLDPEVFE